MAYNDHMFRLGQKLANDTAVTDKKDHFTEVDGQRYAGKHLIIDIYESRGELLSDIDHVDSVLEACVIAAGATVINKFSHHFTPNGGVSSVIVLSESHISIHTWPEAGYAAVDIFTCGSAVPELCMPVLKSGFETEKVDLSHNIMRGLKLDEASWKTCSK